MKVFIEQVQHNEKRDSQFDHINGIFLFKHAQLSIFAWR